VQSLRGGPLNERAFAVAERLEQLGNVVDRDAVSRSWAELVETPPWPGAPVWVHGDLHPANILVDRRTIVGVIDFGDLAAGDPAVDLAVAWMLFAREVRSAFRAAGGEIDDHTWARARGWALHLALAYLVNSADNEVMASIGRHTLAAVLAND
jgi:aminoglycoside phosphotransferase (APT) family kinase protein